jgi:hypothetical protein|tara:strand:+ start:141 stop:683 length:543 start_codon:yes stop_codon:yes gene_type:complete
MFKDFDIAPLKKLKPRSDNSIDTRLEIKELTKIPLNKKFVKENDDIQNIFQKIASKENIKDYDAKLVNTLVKESAPIILKVKKHFNRPRPKVLAKKMNIKLNDIEMASMKTPSYPSGHSVQGILISKVLSDKYPQAKKAFEQAGKNISYSRRVAKAHYKSDSKMGEKMGNMMYEHIKDKV